MNRSRLNANRSGLAATPDQRAKNRPELRRFARIAPSAAITVMSVAERCQGKLQDMSVNGARVKLHDHTFGAGRDVLLRWGANEAFGHIAWVRGPIVGIAFYQSIPVNLLRETVDGEIDVEMKNLAPACAMSELCIPQTRGFVLRWI